VVKKFAGGAQASFAGTAGILCLIVDNLFKQAASTACL